MKKVVVAGHICLDVIPDLSEMNLERPGDFYTPGALKVAKPAKLSTGGPVSNTGLNLTKLGIETVLMGKVGADAFGDMAQLLLKKEWGIENTLIADHTASTSYTVVINPKGFDRMFIHDPGANDTFCASDVDYDQVAECDLFHFGYPPLMKQMIADNGKELIELFRNVHETGLTTSLDMCPAGLPERHNRLAGNLQRTLSASRPVPRQRRGNPLHAASRAVYGASRHIGS
jgi:sugar/nucleoside kinase (ribokinase family)